MKTINLESNFNNKLECVYFTIIRLKSDTYSEGVEYEIMLRGIPIKTATVASIKEIYLENASEFISGLDMGCDMEEMRRHFESTYKNVNWKKQVLYLMLMQTTNVY